MIQGNKIYEGVSTGSFQSGQLIDLLKRLKKDGLTGELNISSRDGDGFIALYRGYITTVFSPGMYATLKENLTQQWLLGETQIKDLIEIQKIEPNNILESRLIKKDDISAESLCRVLKSNSELVLKSMLSWSGLYRFYKDTYMNVPEEILIDIETFEEHEDKTDTKVSYNNLSSSILKMVSHEKDLSNEKVRETLDTVSKRLRAFKPKEVVVVVDENTMTGKILTDGLIGFGFEAEHLKTAHDALERILELEKRRIPVVVVTDIEMNGLSDEADKYGGNELLAYLRDNYPNIPIIIVTSITDPAIKLKSLFMGASYFMKKPEARTQEKDIMESDRDVFIEELSYYIWNVLKGRRYSIQKEEIYFAEDEVINSLLETSSLPGISKENIFGAKLLIADDEPNIRKALKEYLEEDGFLNVDLAENGEQAIESYTMNSHDVIIVDIVMPKKDGIEVLKEIKTKSPNSQVVIITGNADKDSAIAAVRFGAFDYVEKPFDYKVLSKTVSKAVEKKLLLDKK